ncbi:MAG: putative heme d1 biosynthesis radical SAM protein NirJ2 [Anaerovibrio sp.]|uniref:putative heme d1 biosynthesis radical SAM protein NirJ2 n=1 Tax=Anaerovibrio TaxID=82373 RepID=UPI002E776C01|nr:putative heme d1 biosynthesis radical SAM protein NirJ2 [Anaerovibrio sp.]MBQ2010201.1 putative heme d1 biosynthesis radical SAM protein NirJ2 [Selenomonadaceae bacterium]MBQ2410787.1 putative heme d1 biosynthesis radical SAM protein NirJ2 [Selenomonadaceae bacterium]MBQ5650012.1 putative heme d1 biosynthesis radical SAM protein NirJ2 [Selenomonadaceae bacterium]MBQ5731920.1 putative heme d1 biosynthesis radical SAM protein NirJ2 [Selenomonadaceae bacterium]MBQ5920905.1 putative heme d1 bio
MIVSWNTTNACNMYCDHCYRDAGCKAEEELSTAEAKTLLEQIARAGFKIMIFSGGEPLMRPDIVELVAYAASLGLRPVFGTNGTLITLEMAQKLKAAGAMGMGISLDSMDREKHNKFRKFPGAWEGAVQGMRNCRAAGLPFQIHTTVMEWNNHELEDLTDFAVAEGAVAHHFFFLVPTGRAKTIEAESLRAEAYEDTLTRIMKKQQEVEIELKPTCAPQFLRIAAQMGLKTRFRRGCLAGTAYCIISPRGKVQPCAYLNMELGDVRQTPFDEIWKNSEVLNKLRTLEYSGGCGSCEYKRACGGCRARAAYYHEGDYMAEEPWCLYHGRKGQ